MSPCDPATFPFFHSPNRKGFTPMHLMTQTDSEPLTVEQANMLAADLVIQLGATPGDSAAVSATLARWAEELGHGRMAQVCMAAVQLTFADCLTMTRPEEWPTAGGLALRTPERAEA